MNWKKLINVTSPETIGLDVGSAAVKLVQLKRDGDEFKVVAAAKTEIEDSAEKTEHVHDINTVKAILDCYEKSSVDSRLAVCGVNGPAVAVRDFKFPAMPAEEIPSAVHLEAEQVCPFKVAESVVDYQLIPNGEDSVRGVLVAATGKVVKHKDNLVKEATLNPVLMDVDGLALSNCLEQCREYEPGKAIAILNVGNTYTTLVISGEGAVPFVRDTSHAGNSITNQIAEQTQMSVGRVSRILFSPDEDSDQAALLESSFEAVCEPLIDDITGTIRYYTAQKKSFQVEKVLVCGGFARARGFVEILNRYLPAEAVLWNPFDKIKSEPGSAVESFVQQYGCEMAVAAGFAMRSV